tara:strand:+ start:746 stop:1000 length:255 start_codon:yes stop_codon:yes gene_type:complete
MGEHAELDKICDTLNFPSTKFAPMEVAAKYLGVSVRQARHLCANGHIGEKYGHRTWIITRDELIEFKPRKPKLGRPKRGPVKDA